MVRDRFVAGVEREARNRARKENAVNNDMHDLSDHMFSYRARTPEQKLDIIERLYEVWLAHPGLRLGQLIANVYRDPYYIEDYDLVETLERRYSQMDKARPPKLNHTSEGETER